MVAGVRVWEGAARGKEGGRRRRARREEARGEGGEPNLDVLEA